MSENSIKFSLSNSEQRDSWLNSGYRTLDADTEQYSTSCTLVFHTTFIGLSIYLYYVCKNLVVIT